MEPRNPRTEQAMGAAQDCVRVNIYISDSPSGLPSNNNATDINIAALLKYHYHLVFSFHYEKRLFVGECTGVQLQYLFVYQAYYQDIKSSSTL